MLCVHRFVYVYTCLYPTLSKFDFIRILAWGICVPYLIIFKVYLIEKYYFSCLECIDGWFLVAIHVITRWEIPLGCGAVIIQLLSFKFQAVLKIVVTEPLTSIQNYLYCSCFFFFYVCFIFLTFSTFLLTWRSSPTHYFSLTVEGAAWVTLSLGKMNMASLHSVLILGHLTELGKKYCRWQNR